MVKFIVSVFNGFSTPQIAQTEMTFAVSQTFIIDETEITHLDVTKIVLKFLSKKHHIL